MSQRGRELLDGLGADRVCAEMRGKGLYLRPARPGDCKQLYEWASDPHVRSASFHPEPITWEKHQRWFESKLGDPNSVLHLAEDSNGNPLGQVRYQLNGGRATLSLNVDAAVRGHGWGKQLIYFSIRTLLRQYQLTAVDAFVKPENTGSLRLFETSGFHMEGCERVSGQDSVHFTWKADRISE
jgi:UDP-2,4-diacetamido-2,4,6-trideoxy-beta-L-altropyranose hydrolase